MAAGTKVDQRGAWAFKGNYFGWLYYYQLEKYKSWNVQMTGQKSFPFFWNCENIIEPRHAKYRPLASGW